MDNRHMEINVCYEDAGVVVLQAWGEISAYTVSKFKEKIIETKKSIIFSLSNVAYLDSAGIGMLLGIRKKILAKDRFMAIVIANNSSIRNTLQQNGFRNVFEIFASLGKAIDYCNAATTVSAKSFVW